MTEDTKAPAGLTIAGLEEVYDALATALDRAGPQQREVLLVKLALLAAEALGDAQRFGTLLQIAGQDLPASVPTPIP